MSLSLKNTDHTVKMPFTITFKSLHIHQWVNERSPASGVTAKGTGSLVPIFTESMKQGNLGTAHSLPINLFCMCFLPLFPDGTVVKNLPANAGDARDTGLISGLGRSPGVGNGNPLQYFCLENPIDRGAWWVIESMGSERVGHDWAHVYAHTQTIQGSWVKPVYKVFPYGEFCFVLCMKQKCVSPASGKNRNNKKWANSPCSISLTMITK